MRKGSWVCVAERGSQRAACVSHCRCVGRDKYCCRRWLLSLGLKHGRNMRESARENGIRRKEETHQM